MNTRRHTAFTIVELLTVMAILGALMAILFPTLSASRRRAKANVCLTTLKSLGTATQVYLNENRDYFFPARMKKIKPDAVEDYVNDFNRKQPRWQWFLAANMEPVIDPLQFRRLGEPFGDEGLFLGRGEGRQMTTDLFTCPSLDDSRYAMDVRNGAYGYNYQYLGNTRTDTDPTRWDNFAVGMHTIKCPAQTVLMADSRGAGPRHGRHSYALDPPRLATEANALRFGPDKDDVDSAGQVDFLAYSPVEARHDDAGNVAFTDGHAEPMTLLDLGYEINRLDSNKFGMPQIADLPKGIALPVPHPLVGPYKATNRLWNGLCNDPIANEANSAPAGGGGGP